MSLTCLLALFGRIPTALCFNVQSARVAGPSAYTLNPGRYTPVVGGSYPQVPGLVENVQATGGIMGDLPYQYVRMDQMPDPGPQRVFCSVTFFDGPLDQNGLCSGNELIVYTPFNQPPQGRFDLVHRSFLVVCVPIPLSPPAPALVPKVEPQDEYIAFLRNAASFEEGLFNNLFGNPGGGLQAREQISSSLVLTNRATGNFLALYLIVANCH